MRGWAPRPHRFPTEFLAGMALVGGILAFFTLDFGLFVFCVGLLIFIWFYWARHD